MAANVSIRVDDKACVGCSLCVDVCPTKVFEFNEEKAVPEVKKEAECFGCLSCSEICPATALDHGNLVLSQSFYHDPQTLQFAAQLGQMPRVFNAPVGDEKAVAHAVSDLGIRLLSVAGVLKQTLGQSLLSVGTQAGRSLATQLPRYQQPKSIEEALQLTQVTFAPAWDIHFNLQDNKLTMSIKSCFVRELCLKEKIDLGGDLCLLFGGYLAGYLSKTANVRPRLVDTKRDKTECAYSFQLHAVSD